MNTLKGKYIPKNSAKYRGDYRNIIYRSSWERKYMIMCDTRDSVIKWSSEPVEINYIWSFDKREHKYYPDFIAEHKKDNGEIETLVIEVKPDKQTKPPAKPK